MNVGGIFTNDFSFGSGQAYGGTSAHKQLATGIWGMMSGDGDADGQISSQDINTVWKTDAAKQGYLPGDFDLNSQVMNQDKNDKLIPNLNKQSAVP